MEVFDALSPPVGEAQVASRMRLIGSILRGNTQLNALEKHVAAFEIMEDEMDEAGAEAAAAELERKFAELDRGLDRLRADIERDRAEGEGSAGGAGPDPGVLGVSGASQAA